MAKYKRNPSIIAPFKKKSFLSGSEVNLDPHEPIGGSNKKQSEKDGLWIWVTRKEHRWLHDTHEGKMKNKRLQKLAQLTWMNHYGKTEDEFRKVYFISYLEDGDWDEV